MKVNAHEIIHCSFGAAWRRDGGWGGGGGGGEGSRRIYAAEINVQITNSCITAMFEIYRPIMSSLGSKSLGI